jgi:hypothetical protein
MAESNRRISIAGVRNGEKFDRTRPKGRLSSQVETGVLRPVLSPRADSVRGRLSPSADDDRAAFGPPFFIWAVEQ